MALLFYDSFDMYGTRDEVQQRWDRAILAITQTSFSATAGRFGGGAWRFVNTNGGILEKHTYPNNIDTMIVGFLFEQSSTFASGEILQILSDGEVSCNLRFDGPSRTLSLYRGSGTSTLLESSIIDTKVNRYNLFEFKWKSDPSSGIGVFRVDENTVINFSGNTQAGSITTVNQVQLVGAQPTNIDDFYLCDNTGSINNDFLGDQRIARLAPIADASPNDFTPASGIDNYAMVDEGSVDNDSTYVSGSIADTKDLYNISSIPSTPSDIRAVQVVGSMRRTGSQFKEWTSVISSGIFETDGTAKNAPYSYAQVYDIHEFNPDTSMDWEEAEVNNLLIGGKIIS